MVSSDVQKAIQVGLMLPDGTIIWSPELYKQYPLVTNDDRAMMVEVLNKLAGEISFPGGELLTHYAWLKREVFHTTIYGDPTVHNILDPDLITPTPKDGSELHTETGEGPLPNPEDVVDPGPVPGVDV